LRKQIDSYVITLHLLNNHYTQDEYFIQQFIGFPIKGYPTDKPIDIVCLICGKWMSDVVEENNEK